MKATPSRRECSYRIAQVKHLLRRRSDEGYRRSTPRPGGPDQRFVRPGEAGTKPWVDRGGLDFERAWADALDAHLSHDLGNRILRDGDAVGMQVRGDPW